MILTILVNKLGLSSPYQTNRGKFLKQPSRILVAWSMASLRAVRGILTNQFATCLQGIRFWCLENIPFPMLRYFFWKLFFEKQLGSPTETPENIKKGWDWKDLGAEGWGSMQRIRMGSGEGNKAIAVLNTQQLRLHAKSKGTERCEGRQEASWS